MDPTEYAAGHPGKTASRLFADGDLLGLGFFPLRDADRQDAVLVGRADLGRIDRGREGERTAEAAVEAFQTLEAVARDLLVELALAGNGEHVVLESQADFLALHLGQFRLENHLLLRGLVDIDRRHPRAGKAFAVKIAE